MATRRHGRHEDTIENLLDKLGIMREELVSIERSLERIKVAKPGQRRVASGTDGSALNPQPAMRKAEKS